VPSNAAPTTNDSRIRVAIDLTSLTAQHTGVDRYLKELVFNLARIDATNEYTVFVNAADRRLFAGRLPRNFRILAWCLRPRPARLTFQQAVVPAACAALGADVLHSPSFLMPYCRGRQRHLVTVHDMTFFSMPQVHNRLRRSAAFRCLVMTSIRRAHMINVPSRATRDALLESLPEVPPDKVRVTKYGVSSSFCPAPPEEVSGHRLRLGLPDSYVLYVGTLEPRKNLELLVESYRKMLVAGEIVEHLVLAGKHGFAYESLLEQLRMSPLRDRIHLSGFVAEDDLLWLYRGARLFVYPSLAEGFGFPPLEAMACGVPVISTLGSSLEENLQGAAELVPPRDAPALADAMRRLLRDEGLRDRRKQDGLRRVGEFRWESTAGAILACYRQLAKPDARRLADAQRTIARAGYESYKSPGGAADDKNPDHRQTQKEPS
jgi:glycosyltransferase involved in cell wall biosynthesis